MIVRLFKTVLILTMVFTTAVTSMSTIQEPEQVPAEDVTVSEFSDETVLAGDISEHVTLRWYLHGSNVTDDTQVLAIVNEYLNETLNVTLEPIWGTWGDFDTNAVLSLHVGENVDLYFTCSWSANEYNQFSREGYYVRLDDPENNLLQNYGQGLLGTIPENVWTGALTSGYLGVGNYAVPNMGYCTRQYGWEVNVDLLEKYGYSLADIEGYSYSELSDVLYTVKKGEGKSFYPVFLCDENAVTCLEVIATDSFVVSGEYTGWPILAYYANADDIEKEGPYGTSLLNRYGTEEYKAFVEQSWEYAEDGIINPGIFNYDEEEYREIDASGEWLIKPSVVDNPNYDVDFEWKYDMPVAFVPVTSQYISTELVQQSMTAISTTSANVERAMMFLNLLNTDPQLMTMLSYGIEGIHYGITSDGLLQYRDARADYQPWRNGMGNISISPVIEGVADANYWEETYWPYINYAKTSPILGFTVNSSDMVSQRVELESVVEGTAKYMSAGFLDPKTELPNFNNSLDVAGIDEYVEEAQKQLDEFLAYK